MRWPAVNYSLNAPIIAPLNVRLMPVFIAFRIASRQGSCANEW